MEILYGKWYNKLVVSETVNEDAEHERATVKVGYEFENEKDDE